MEKKCSFIDYIFTIFLIMFIFDSAMRVSNYDSNIKLNKNLIEALNKNTEMRKEHIKELRRVEDKTDTLIKNYFRN